MLVAIDVDSTLHDYWTQFRAAAWALHAVDLPYAEQTAWEVDALSPQQVRDVVHATHDDTRIAEAVAYPGAADVIAGWRAHGHEVLITTHRRPDSHDVTADWLRLQGIPYDVLRCGWRKVDHCREVGASLLIDDSPENLIGALAAGIGAATISHPWNRDLIRTDPRVVHGSHWQALGRALDETLLQHG